MTSAPIEATASAASPAAWVGDQPIPAQALVNLLRRNGKISSLLQELVLEQALAEIQLSAEGQAQHLATFRQQQGLEQEEAYQAFLQNRLLSEELLLATVCRPQQVVRYREERWGPRAQSLYLQRKERYDRIRYRRLQVADADLIQELYFRLKDGEAGWDELALQLEPNNPQATSLVGPVPVVQVEPEVVEALRAAGPGRITRPLILGNLGVVAALEEILPAEFNEELRTQVLREAFDEWVAEECSKMQAKLRFLT